MKAQLSSIDSSLQAQLKQIDSQLAELEATLKEKQYNYDALSVGIWVAIGTTIAGIGLIIAGFFFPPAAPYLWASGGLLVLGSVVAIGVLSYKKGKLSSAIYQLNSSINELKTSKQQLTAIRESFTKLSSSYSDLPSF